MNSAKTLEVPSQISLDLVKEAIIQQCLKPFGYERMFPTDENGKAFIVDVELDLPEIIPIKIKYKYEQEVVTIDLNGCT